MTENKNAFHNLRMRATRILGNMSERTQGVVRNIGMSFVARMVSILCTMLIVPLTIDYVNPTSYGIWMTFASVIAWIGYFNFGLANGFRNRFAEARAEGNDLLARQYLSTTYFAITIVVAVLYLLTILLNSMMDWASFLHLDSAYAHELSSVFLIMSSFVCLNMIVNIYSTLLTADQRPGIAAIIQAAGQVASLAAIWLLTRLTEGSLVNLALYLAGAPVAVMFIVQVASYRWGRYRRFAPAPRFIRPSLIRNIIVLGLKFFAINICLIVVFHMTDLVITREVGPEGTAQYNIAKRYFNIILMAMTIIITPFWSSFTEAYVKHDTSWMKNSLRRLEQLWLVSLAGGMLMLLLSDWFYGIWIGDKLEVPFLLSLSTLAFIESQTLGNIYMHLVNGIGTIRLQTILYVIIALVAWPCMVYGGRQWGICGVLLLPTAAYLVQAIAAKVQLTKILSGTARGIWLQ